MTAPRKPAPTSARRVVIMTPPCHSACNPRLYEKDIDTGGGAKDTKELLRRGHSLGVLLLFIRLPVFHLLVLGSHVEDASAWRPQAQKNWRRMRWNTLRIFLAEGEADASRSCAA